MNNQETIDKIFSRLDLWRNFPDYQLERRADIFISLYIEDLIQAKYGSTIDILIPEFPIRKGHVNPESIRDANLSTKMDYLGVSEADKRVYFIELKTNQGSLNAKQDEYLLKAKEINIQKLVDGVIQISQSPNASAKYGHLLHELSKIGWIDNSRFQPQNKSADYEIKIVYIQPHNTLQKEDVISFDDIISYLSSKEDDFTKRFLESISKWKSLDKVPPKPSLFSK